MAEEQVRKPEEDVSDIWVQLGMVMGAVLAFAVISATILMAVNHFSAAGFKATNGPLEYGYNPTLQELQEARDVRVVDVVHLERYVFRTNGGSDYECDSWSGKCQNVERRSEGND